MTKQKIEKCLGIEVRFDPKARVVSDSRGLWRWKKIVVGPDFLRLPPAEQQAILVHEVGHCKMRHLEKRIASLWLLLWSPTRLIQLCHEQEFQADRYAAGCGYGSALAQALGRFHSTGSGFWHPALAERIARLSI